MAVLTYWILYDQVDRNWIATAQTLTRRRTYRFLIGSICCIIGGGVIFSRVALGVHTWSQLLLGAAVGLFTITFFTYDLWNSMLHKMLPKLTLWMSGYALSLLVFTIAMLFINHQYRERPDYWRYFSKCPPCLGSFVYGQSQSLGLAFFQMGFVIGFPQKDGTTAGVTRTILLTDQKVKRYFLYLSLMVPAILVVGVYEFVIRSKLSSSQTAITSQSLLGLFVYGICTFYLGFATSNLRVWVFKKFDLHREDIDLLYKDDLLVKQTPSEDLIDLGAHRADESRPALPVAVQPHRQVSPETQTNQISFMGKAEEKSMIG